MSTINEHNIPTQLSSPQPLSTIKDNSRPSAPQNYVDISATENTSSWWHICWPCHHQNSEPYDINEARPSQESNANDSFCGGWMTTIGNLFTHYCGCPE